MRYLSAVPGVLALGVLLGAGMQDKPKSIKEVMALHKESAKGAKDSLLDKILGGKSAEGDVKKLLEAYEVMAGQKAPQGDEKSWKDKTEALVAAAKGVSEKKEGGVDKLKAASNCKACHSVHKPAK